MVFWLKTRGVSKSVRLCPSKLGTYPAENTEKNNKIEMIKLNKETSNLEIMKECNILYPQIQSHKRVNT